MRFVYAHGFASSPQSLKAEAFRTALAGRGVALEVPALDEGDFEHLTISGQLAMLEREIRSEPVCLVGSSMGGFVASLYAAVHPEVAKLVLLAPAFGFARRWQAKIGAAALDLAQETDEARGGFEVFHYGEQRMRRVHYGLIEDALRYPSAPDFTQPAMIFHGVQDDTVPIEASRAFAASHANARLIELDSDHELLNVLDEIVATAEDFLLARG
jgi:hypothetical protein